MSIVKSLVLPLRYLHYPLDFLLFCLVLTRSTTIPMHHSLRSPLGYSSFDPVTLPLTDSYHHPSLHHRQLPSKYSLYNLSPLLSFHRHLFYPSTLTYLRCPYTFT